MRIVYVAKHDQSCSNDDEGAIHHALTSLGHDVQRIREERGHKAWKLEGDFLLFHKWHNLDALQRVKMPKVFWNFDLVDSRVSAADDPMLAKRDASRRKWMQDVTPLVALGFCTDGDWVLEDGRRKLVWLPQGADERVVGRGNPACEPCDVLFTGLRKAGKKRESFVDEMAERYGSRFKVVERGVHGRALADLIASAKIVVAPDFPVTDVYWSNRVYLTLGFGGFLLHPWCNRLAAQYDFGKEIICYRSRKELYEQIEWFLSLPDIRWSISQPGLERTMNEHTYRHRCKELIETVKERLGIR